MTAPLDIEIAACLVDGILESFRHHDDFPGQPGSDLGHHYLVGFCRSALGLPVACGRPLIDAELRALKARLRGAPYVIDAVERGP